MIKRYDKKQKNWVIFGKSHFFDQKSLNLVKTQRNSSLFFVKYSKLNEEHEFDATNFIKCSFTNGHFRGIQSTLNQNIFSNGIQI